MTAFTGTGGSDSADSTTGELLGFTGGSVADLQDGIGDFFDCDGGDDRVTGGAGGDTMVGGDGDDTFFFQFVGEAVGDTLQGGRGNDTMTGGSEGDVVLYSDQDALFGQDTINDFQDGIDGFKVHANVADNINDFAITGNGTDHVVLTLIANGSNRIALDGAAPITITAGDFVFY